MSDTLRHTTHYVFAIGDHIITSPFNYPPTNMNTQMLAQLNGTFALISVMTLWVWTTTRTKFRGLRITWVPSIMSIRWNLDCPQLPQIDVYLPLHGKQAVDYCPRMIYSHVYPAL